MVVTEIGRGRIHSIHTSPGGVPKRAAPTALVTADRLEGDDHNDTRNHGGPDRAVCLYSLESIEALRADGHPIFPGSVGENITVTGLQWEAVVPGCRLKIGPVLLEVSKYAAPCKIIRESFTEHNFNRISQKLYPGWSRVYARVLSQGEIQTGQEVLLQVGPGPVELPLSTAELT